MLQTNESYAMLLSHRQLFKKKSSLSIQLSHKSVAHAWLWNNDNKPLHLRGYIMITTQVSWFIHSINALQKLIDKFPVSNVKVDQHTLTPCPREHSNGPIGSKKKL